MDIGEFWVRLAALRARLLNVDRGECPVTPIPIPDFDVIIRKGGGPTIGPYIPRGAGGIPTVGGSGLSYTGSIGPSGFQQIEWWVVRNSRCIAAGAGLGASVAADLGLAYVGAHAAALFARGAVAWGPGWVWNSGLVLTTNSGRVGAPIVAGVFSGGATMLQGSSMATTTALPMFTVNYLRNGGMSGCSGT
jgi:hypothetical protein